MGRIWKKQVLYPPVLDTTNPFIHHGTIDLSIHHPFGIHHIPVIPIILPGMSLQCLGVSIQVLEVLQEVPIKR